MLKSVLIDSAPSITLFGSLFGISIFLVSTDARITQKVAYIQIQLDKYSFGMNEIMLRINTCFINKIFEKIFLLVQYFMEAQCRGRFYDKRDTLSAYALNCIRFHFTFVLIETLE